ncbi:MAG: SIMPL domain-containing protein, partial [Sphingomonadaceae bacterium]|nr:SIMPL domain-containing protein [Sphingomonadaceae bacterium]
ATATGMHVARIRSIVEGSSEAPAPRPIMMMARAKADDTPVAPGEVSLGASVTVVFELN